MVYSDPNIANSIVYQHTLLSYQLKTSHWNFSRAATLHLCNMADRGEKLQQPHCYHPFSDSRDTYLTKNHYENYSPKMVPTNPTGSWTITRSIQIRNAKMLIKQRNQMRHAYFKACSVCALYVPVYVLAFHYSDVIMSAIASQIAGVSLFTQPFIQMQIKENINAPRHRPLWGEFTSDRWIPRTKDQWRGKSFHLMTSSYIPFIAKQILITLQYSNMAPYLFKYPPAGTRCQVPEVANKIEYICTAHTEIDYFTVFLNNPKQQANTLLFVSCKETSNGFGKR